MATLVEADRVATWVAGIAITGFTVVDATKIPLGVKAHECPLVCPDVNAPFVTDIRITRVTFKPRVWDVEYRLHYMLYYAPLGASGLTPMSAFNKLLQAFTTVISSFTTHEDPTNYSNAYDIVPIGTPTIGAVADPTGALFHGAKFEMLVTERKQ